MKGILYLVQQNTILRKRGKRLLLCHRPPASRRYSAVLQKDIILDLPIVDVSQVMIFGNIQITTSALHILLQHGVELSIFTYGGKLLGQLTPPLGKNLPLRMKQYQQYGNSEFVLRISRAIVNAKISNSLKFIRAYLSNHEGCFNDEELNKFKQLSRDACNTNRLESLRGIEGAASAHYFYLFRRMIEPPFKFSGRNKHPPLDPVNAVLSFGYVIVSSQLQSLLDGIGLNPFLGFYHQPEYGRPSLALDILEEFRQPLVDRLCIYLFNKKILKESDFWKHSSGGIYLNTEGKRKFFQHYQKLLIQIVPDKDNRGMKGFYPLFQRQVSRMSKSISQESPYLPYIMR